MVVYKPRKKSNKKTNKKYVPKKYVKKSKPMTSVNVKKIVNEIMNKKCEKKEYNTYGAALSVSQMWAGAAGATPTSGHYISSAITPLPLNGTSDTTRVGDEIHLTGMRNIFQFYHQSNTTVGIKCKMIIFTPKGSVSGQSTTIDKLFNSNPIIYNGNGALFPVVYDTMSSRNMDYIKEFNILRTINFYVPPDPATQAQKIIKTVNCGLKFKKPHVMRWDTSGNLAHGQIWVIILAESGNASGNTPNLAGTTGIPISDTVSGLYMQYYSKSYFIDP